MAQPAFIKTTGGLGLEEKRRGSHHAVTPDDPRRFFARKETVWGEDLAHMISWVSGPISNWKERLFGRRDLIVYIDGDHLRPVPFSCFSFRQLLDRLG